MAWATVEEWLARTKPQVAKDLTVDPDAIVQSPDLVRIANALDDATAELEGYVPRIPEAHRPSDATKRIHCIKVATYLLTLSLPSGKEFETIRNAYTDTIAFYTSAIEQANAAAGTPPASVVGCAPPPVFTPDTLKGFT